MEEDSDINNHDEKTANEYGQKMKDLEDLIKKTEIDLEKAKKDYDKAFEPKELSLESIIKKEIIKHKAGIVNSLTNFPERTPEESINIFIKRYNLSGTSKDIMDVLKSMKFI